MRTNMKWLAAIGIILVLLLTVCAATAEVTETVGKVTVSTLGTPPETPETYTIRLTADGDFPMPAGSKTGSDGKQYFDLAVKGTNDGTDAGASFPSISYDRVGEYTYTVKMIPGTAEGATYDSSMYDVKVTVYNNEDYSGFETAVAVRLHGKDKKVPITFVVTYPVEKTEKTIVKVWKDNEDQDGIRSPELTAVLKGGKKTWSVTLNEDNGWTATVKDLDKYEENTRKPITYTWSEVDPGEGYEGSAPVIDGDTTTITNTHEPEQTEVSVEKIWDDKEDQDGIRPKGDVQLRVTLLGNDKEVATVLLNEDNDWKATLTVDKYDAGEEIEYTWTEKNPPTGYTLSGTATSGAVTTLTNTHKTETTTATIVKVWDDNKDQDGKRPEKLTVVLSDGTKVTLNEENNWRATVKNLPKYKDGKEIEYTWKEDNLPAGYEMTDSSADGTITTIKNTHKPSEIKVTIKKVWDDDDNQDGFRKPVTLVLTGSAGGTAVVTETWEVKDDKTLEHTFTVPEYWEGKKITYTVNEPEVPAGYSKTVDNKTLTVTNKHDPETTEVLITKVWKDESDYDGLRPGNITVELLRNGEVAETITIKGTGDIWTYKATGLPKYTDGVENVYTLREVKVPGYTSEVKGYAITNTHEVEKTTSVTVKKVWDDKDNKYKKRPTEITVTLKANGKAIQTVKLNANNKWTATVSDLPTMENGKKIKYTWAEAAITGYTLSKTDTEVTADGQETTLTNKYKTGTPGKPEYGAPLGFGAGLNIGDCLE